MAACCLWYSTPSARTVPGGDRLQKDSRRGRIGKEAWQKCKKKNGRLLPICSHHFLKSVTFFHRVISRTHRTMRQAHSGEHIIDEVSRFKTVKIHDSKIIMIPFRHWEEEFSGRHEGWTHRLLAEVCENRCTETLCVDANLDRITTGWNNGLFFYQDGCGYVMWRT